jgi:hypothetical protein
MRLLRMIHLPRSPFAMSVTSPSAKRQAPNAKRQTPNAKRHGTPRAIFYGT